MRRNEALARARSSDGRDAEPAAVHRSLLWLYENEDHQSPMHGQRDEVLMSLRALAGGTAELFAALAELAAGAPQTGRRYRASAVLFALGFESRHDVERHARTAGDISTHAVRAHAADLPALASSCATAAPSRGPRFRALAPERGVRR